MENIIQPIGDSQAFPPRPNMMKNICIIMKLIIGLKRKKEKIEALHKVY